jgi:hypothetical protein
MLVRGGYLDLNPISQLGSQRDMSALEADDPDGFF